MDKLESIFAAVFGLLIRAIRRWTTVLSVAVGHVLRVAGALQEGLDLVLIGSKSWFDWKDFISRTVHNLFIVQTNI